MTLRQAFLRGLRDVKAVRFTLLRGLYFHNNSGSDRPCGCAIAMIAFGARKKTTIFPEHMDSEEICSYLNGAGMKVAQETLNEIDGTFESELTVDGGIAKLKRKFFPDPRRR